MTARILSALRRFEDSLAGDIAGVIALFVLLEVALFVPLILGGAR